MIIKNDKELRAIREGGRHLGTILRTVAEKVAPGVSAAELDRYARELIKKTGGKAAFLNYRPKREARAFPAALCVSINEEIVHGIPNEREKILKEGDIVTLDGGLTYEGLITDSAVTVIVGKGDAKAKRLVAAVEEALAAGIKEAKAEAHVGNIGAAVAAVAKKYGYSIPKELAGHGVGRAVHEEPNVPNIGKRGTGAILKEGMVIAIEPMFAEGKPEIEQASDGFTLVMSDGSRSAHAEHTVLITKTDAEILTTRE